MTVFQYHIANLNRRVLQYQENDFANHNNDGVNRLTDGVNDGVNLGSDGVKGDNDVTKQLNRTLQRVYQAIVNKPEIISTELMEILSISESTVTRSTRELKKLGFIKRECSDKIGRWIILK